MVFAAIKARGESVARGDPIRTKPQHPSNIPQRASNAGGKDGKSWKPSADGSPDVDEKKEFKEPKAPLPAPPTTTKKMVQDSFSLDDPELLARRQKEIREFVEKHAREDELFQKEQRLGKQDLQEQKTRRRTLYRNLRDLISL